MKIENMDRVLMGGMAAMIGIMAVASVVQASTPKLEYICPICGAKYASYEELYNHFTTEHPAEPIDIIWE